MSVSSSAVEIRINVVDGNTQQTVAQFSNSMNQLGAAGAGSGQKIKKGMEEAGVGMLSTREKTKLFSEEVGIHLPKSFQKLISQSKVAQVALNAVTSAMVGLAAVQIGAIVFEAGINAAKRFYDKWLDVDGAIQQYNDKAAIAAAQKFDDNRSLAQVNADLREANTLIDQLSQKKASVGRFTQWMGNLSEGATKDWGFRLPGYKEVGANFGVADANTLNTAQGHSDKDRWEAEQKRHTAALAAIRDNALVDGARLTGIDKARRAQRAAEDEAREETRNRVEQQNQLATVSERAGKRPGEEGYVPRPGAHDFDAEENTARAHAQAQFRAQEIEDARATRLEILHIHDQAEQAGLKGIALLDNQRKAADRDYVLAHGRNAQVLADIDRKYYAQEKTLADENLKQHQAAEAELQNMRRETLLGSMTGAARTRQEGQNKLDRFYETDHPNMDPGQRLATVHEIVNQTGQAITQEQQAFADRVNGIVEQTTDRTVTGFARIHADAQRQIDALRQDASENGGTPDVLARGEAGIRAREAMQSTELARRNAQETDEIEAQARIKSLSAERQQSAAIYAEYEDRVRKYHDQLVAKEILEEDYNRRVAAAAQIRDAEMAEASKAAHDKMAHEFTGFFRSLDRPMDALKQVGDKVAGDFAATMVQRFQQRGEHGQHGAPAEHESGVAGFFGDLFGRGNGGKNSAAPQTPASGHPGSGSGAGKVFALQTATIHIQSANVLFSGTGAIGRPAPGIGGGGTALATGAPGTSYGISSGSTTAAGAYNGGAGSSTAATLGNITTTAGSAPIPGNAVATGINNASQGLSLYKQASSTFSGLGGSGEAGTSSSLASAFGGGGAAGAMKGSGKGGMLGGGGIKANGMDAIGGAVGMYSAVQGNGGVGGALGGAMSGMQLGMALGGPVGAAIGAAAGAIVGLIGFGGREKARVYDLQQVRPRLGNDMDAFQHGSMDYTSAYSDAESLQTESWKTTGQMGPAARKYWGDTIKPEILAFEQKLTREQKAGRSAYGASAAQFDVGGPIGGFGAMATSSDHGWIHAQRGEFMVQQQAALPHYQALQAINGGASHSDLARYYGGRDDQVAPAQTGDSTHNWTVNAVDARSFVDMLRNNRHEVRSAYNESLAEYSGVADV